MFVHSVPFLRARSLNQRNIKKFFLPTSRSWTRYRLAMRQLSKPQIHRNRCLSDDWQPARTFPPNIEILFLYAHNQANLRLLFQRPESPSEAPKTPPGDEKMTKNFDSCWTLRLSWRKGKTQYKTFRFGIYKQIVQYSSSYPSCQWQCRVQAMQWTGFTQ